MKIFLFVFCLMFYEAKCVEIDDVCSVDGIEYGAVKTLAKCGHITKLLKEKKIDEVKKLSVDENRMLFCCPARKSIRACKGFGIRPDEPDRISRRIIGGTAAEPGEFPHFASLAYIVDDGKVRFDCAGSLISEKFVLTAAHCCSKKMRIPIFVRLGKTSLNTNDANDPFEAVDIDIQDTILHPDYSIRRKYHNIALVKLKDSAGFGFNIWPACLVPEYNLATGANLLIAGFGRDDVNDASKTSTWLLKGTVQEVSLAACRRDYDKKLTVVVNENVTNTVQIPGCPDGITDNLICANNREKHVDTCQGDSGSGLIVHIDDDAYVHGISSFGLSCNTRLPSFYTRVSSYIDWIEQTVWG